MRLILSSLIVLALVLPLASQTSQYYIPEKHDRLQEFVGDWSVIFASNADEATAPAVGRGTAKGNSKYGGVLVELDANMKYQVGSAENRIVLGYDINQKSYYFMTYNSQGRTPALLFGNYNSSKKEYKFFNTEGDKVLSYITLTFERDDKFIIRSFIKSEEEDKKTLEIAYIKESKE